MLRRNCQIGTLQCFQTYVPSSVPLFSKWIKNRQNDGARKKIATIATFYSAAGEFNHLTVCLRKMGRWQKKNCLADAASHNFAVQKQYYQDSKIGTLLFISFSSLHHKIRQCCHLRKKVHVVFLLFKKRNWKVINSSLSALYNNKITSASWFSAGFLLPQNLLCLGFLPIFRNFKEECHDFR